jgi:hypothetical protein
MSRGLQRGRSTEFSTNPSQTLFERSALELKDVLIMSKRTFDMARSTGEIASLRGKIEVAKMIYEMDKRQLLRLWSVLSCFGEIQETKDPIIQSEILRRAQAVLTDFVFGLKRVAEAQTSSAALAGGRSQTVTFDA